VWVLEVCGVLGEDRAAVCTMCYVKSTKGINWNLIINIVSANL
jgi:hypothetical protein